MPYPVFWLINAIVWLIIWTLIINAILSWLIAFEVVNRRNRVVEAIWDMTTRLTDPLLNPIRRIVPRLGGLDLSPLILIIGLQFIMVLIEHYVPIL